MASAANTADQSVEICELVALTANQATLLRGRLTFLVCHTEAVKNKTLFLYSLVRFYSAALAMAAVRTTATRALA
ncbi:MAG TPA: hypothetical protein VMU50_04765, partial [Polyangia bacterium]|nr:hypothetical protein [Polyangia bacterium]